MWRTEVRLVLRSEGADHDELPIGRTTSTDVVRFVCDRLLAEAEDDAGAVQEVDPVLEILARAEAGKLRTVIEGLVHEPLRVIPGPR